MVAQHGCSQNAWGGGKVRWKLYKDPVYCSEKILGAVSLKTAAIWTFILYLPNHSSKMNKTSLLEKQE